MARVPTRNGDEKWVRLIIEVSTETSFAKVEWSETERTIITVTDAGQFSVTRTGAELLYDALRIIFEEEES